MASTRIGCDIEGLEHNWVELSSKWTRGEIRTLENATDDTLLDLLKRKITSCYIELDNGEVLQSADELTEEMLDEADLRVYTWLFASMFTQIDRLRALGFTSSRLSSTTNGRQPKAIPASEK